MLCSMPSKMDTGPISSGPKALIKGAALVDIVARSPRPLLASEIAAQSELPRATALRIIDALTDLGLLHTAPDQTLTLGPHIAYWGAAYANQHGLAQLAQPIMDDLRDTSSETIYLGIRDGSEVSYIGHSHTRHAIRPAANTGARNPLHSTAIGKVLLSDLDPGERDASIATLALTPRTADTITDPARLRAELARIATAGYAIDDIENEEGVRCIAAPLRDASGRARAAISVSAPSYRFSLEDAHALAPVLLAHAATISTRLGYTHPHVKDLA